MAFYCSEIFVWIVIVVLLKLQVGSCWSSPFEQNDNKFKGIYWNEHDFTTGVYGNEWIRMSTSELSSYYSLYEQCFLTTPAVELGLCQDYPDNFEECNAGDIGTGHTIGGCLNNFGNLYRHKSTKPWPQNKNIVDLIKLMKERGSNTLLLLGDSVSGQFLSDAKCAIRRFGLSTDFPQPPDQNFPLSMRKYSFALYSQGPDAKKDMPMFQLIFHRLEFSDIESSVTEAITHIQTSPYTAGKVVAIVNIGLHYNSPAALQPAIEHFFPPLLSFAMKGHSVFFRETTAQHFHSDTGLYQVKAVEPEYPRIPLVSAVTTIALRSGLVNASEGLKRKLAEEPIEEILGRKEIYDEFRCFPIANETMAQAQNFRNHMVAEYLRRHDPVGSIAIIPFFNMTVSRYDFHLISHDQTDCTHYCFGPLLWEPVWNFVAVQYAKLVRD